MWSQRDGRLSTITKVKVLSPEMFIALGEDFSMSETSIAVCVSGECASNVPGSKAMVGTRIVCTGTWESHIVPIVEASNELKRRRRKYGDMAVGLTHSSEIPPGYDHWAFGPQMLLPKTLVPGIPLLIRA